MPHTRITDADLRRELTAADWRNWLRPLQAEWRSSTEGRKYMRFDKGPIKRLKEEVVPTLRLLERYFAGAHILARFPADNSAADAELRRPTVSTRRQIQITCDHDHETELRLKILHRDGMVSGSGPIKKINGRLEGEGRAYGLDEVIDGYFRTFAARAEKKFAKCADPEMWLLVHINDERLPPEGQSELVRRVRGVAARSPYAATFLVGSTDEQQLCDLLAGTAPI